MRHKMNLEQMKAELERLEYMLPRFSSYHRMEEAEAWIKQLKREIKEQENE